jgi:hypothetical protein
MVTAAVAGRPDVTRAAGQRLARQELSKSIYHPGVPLIQRIENWISGEISRLLQSAGIGGTSGGWWAVVALAALLVIAVAVVSFWIGPVARKGRRGPDAALSGGELSARDHRQKAERSAAAGDFTAAIIESVRAIARGLEERGILAPRLGRTANELAAEASRPLPEHTRGLAQAARLFDDLLYGGRDGTQAGYRQVRDLDTALQAARPAIAAGQDGVLTGSVTGPVT